MTVSLSSTVCFTRAVVGNIRGNVLNKLLLVESERKVSFTNISMKHTYVVWQPFRGKPLFRHPDLCHVIWCDVRTQYRPTKGYHIGRKCVWVWIWQQLCISYTEPFMQSDRFSPRLVNSVSTWYLGMLHVHGCVSMEFECHAHFGWIWYFHSPISNLELVVGIWLPFCAVWSACNIRYCVKETKCYRIEATVNPMIVDIYRWKVNC